MVAIILILAVAAAVYFYVKVVKPETARQESITRICAICEKEFHAAYPKRTDNGQEFCPRCESEYCLDKLKDKELRQMDEETIEIYCACILASKEAEEKFETDEEFFNKKILVDIRNGLVRFKDHFYTYDANNAFAIVHNLVLREGEVSGQLYVYFFDAFFPVQSVRVKFSPKGFGKKRKAEAALALLEQLSDLLGGAPLLSPKEFKKYRKTLFNEAVTDYFGDSGVDGEEIHDLSGGSAKTEINFFAGCQDTASAQKRRRDLSKLYHPDAQSGDDSVIKIINDQYHEFVRIDKDS